MPHLMVTVQCPPPLPIHTHLVAHRDRTLFSRLAHIPGTNTHTHTHTQVKEREREAFFRLFLLRVGGKSHLTFLPSPFPPGDIDGFLFCWAGLGKRWIFLFQVRKYIAWHFISRKKRWRRGRKEWENRIFTFPPRSTSTSPRYPREN